MSTAEQKQQLTVFTSKLDEYKQAIDADIDTYARQMQHKTLQGFGRYSRVATDAYLDILQRGGKRIRGALLCLAYEMAGGKNQEVALKAARAIEMMQAYILIVDDIQDRSAIRRGGPAAHKLLEQFHEQNHMAGESEHFGVAVAINAALGGAHEAQMILAELPCDKGLRLQAISTMNQTMLVTSHGQTNDIVNELIATVDEQAVDRVLEWKTAHYTFLNPLQVGLILAGASKEEQDSIVDYAMHAGRAFQITDDILGTFGEEQESGKSPMDDLKEGKRTLLTVYALEHASKPDQNFLLQSLGNQTISPAEFERCKKIIHESGALDYSNNQAKAQVSDAIKSIDKLKNGWTKEGRDFLTGLAQYLLIRTK
jgi:geranylgeranyl diphosphate synthase, type I